MTTLKSQKRNVLEFMTQAVVANRGGTATPSLLPDANNCSDAPDLLTAASFYFLILGVVFRLLYTP